MTRPFLVAAISVAALACGTTEPDIQLQVWTDQDTYTLFDGSAPVAVHLQNVGARAVAVAGCPAPPFTVAEQHVEGSWQDGTSYGIICQAVHTLQTVTLAAGSRLDYEVSLFRPGVYRLRVLAGVDLVYPDAVVRSNEFSVR